MTTLNELMNQRTVSASLLKETEKESVNEEAVYKAVHKALHPVLVKLTNQLGGKEDNEDIAKDLLGKAIREYMQEELTY